MHSAKEQNKEVTKKRRAIVFWLGLSLPAFSIAFFTVACVVRFSRAVTHPQYFELTENKEEIASDVVSANQAALGDVLNVFLAFSVISSIIGIAIAFAGRKLA